MSIKLSLADLNKIKYIQHQQRVLKRKQAQAKKRPLKQFSRKYFYSGYKFSNFIRKLDNNEPFSYARYNDGEFICLFGDTPDSANVDKHQYFPKMRDEMLTALTKPSNWEDSRNGTYFFQLGMWIFEGPQAKKYFAWMQKFLNENPKLSMKFLPKDPFVRMFQNYEKLFKQLLVSLNRKHLVMVGPEYIKELKVLTGIKHHIVVPEKNCYLEQDRIQQEIQEYVAQHGNETLVFLFSTSMMANTLIDRLHSKYKRKHFLLDMGSVWDNFIPGRESRTYMTKFKKRWKNQYPEWIK